MAVSGPAGPYGPVDVNTAWDGTSEGADLNNAWNYHLAKLQGPLPAHVQELKNIVARPIEG